MAYLAPNKILEDEEKNTYATSSVGSSSVPSSSVPVEDKPNPTSGWVNLQDFLSANQNDGEKLANGMTSGINGKADNFIKDTVSTSNSVVDGYDQQKNSNEQLGQTIVAGINQDASNIKDAAKSYLGSTISPYDTSKIYSDKDAISSRLNAMGTEEGKRAGYMDLNKKNPYANSFYDLDKFLMDRNANARTNFKNTAERSNEVTSVADSAKANIDAAYNWANTGLTKAKDSIKGVATTNKVTKEGNLSTDASNYGIQNISNQGFQGASIGDVITQDEQADLDALAEISGVTATPYGKTYNAGVAAPIVDSSKTLKPNNSGTLPVQSNGGTTGDIFKNLVDTISGDKVHKVGGTAGDIGNGIVDGIGLVGDGIKANPIVKSVSNFSTSRFKKPKGWG